MMRNDPDAALWPPHFIKNYKRGANNKNQEPRCKIKVNTHPPGLSRHADVTSQMYKCNLKHIDLGMDMDI